MAPSVIFVVIFFVIPTALFLFRSIDNPDVIAGLPSTCAALDTWTGAEIPAENVFEALVGDLVALKDTSEIATLARRLNYNVSGFRTLLLNTTKHLPLQINTPATSQLIEIESGWNSERYWAAIKRQCGRLTTYYLLTALDLHHADDGSITTVSADTAVFLNLFGRTLLISCAISVMCLLLGFPVAVVMAKATPQVANILLLLVLLPFWTSLLIRSTAWVILLQKQGPLNQALIWLGVVDEPIQLVFNRVGLYIAMVHVLLPYMILPLYSRLKGLPPEYMRAAESLGAGPLQRFTRIYLPLAMPGFVVGAGLVFVLSLGYYITPALVGGPSDQMVGYFIAYFTNSAVNWGMASALGTILLLIVLLIYIVMARLVGIRAFRAYQ